MKKCISFLLVLALILSSIITPFPPSQVQAAGLNGDGLKGEYFNGKNFETKVYERVDSVIDFSWGQGSPDATIGETVYSGVNTDNFSIRWTGFIMAPSTGDFRFHVTSNDGSRLFIDGVQVTDKWWDGIDTADSPPIALTKGKLYPIILEHYEGVGGASCKLEWTNPNGTKAVVLQKYLYSASLPSGDGLKGEYFNSEDFTDKKFEKIDSTVNFQWGSGSPQLDENNKLRSDHFSVRWTGSIKAPVTGTYTFYVHSNDGGRLWINEQQLVDRWTPGVEENSGTIDLVEGHVYSLRLDMYEGVGSALCELRWAATDLDDNTVIEKEIIPQQYLYSNTLEPITIAPPVEEIIPIGDPVDYYVSPNGDDANDGKSADAPFKTLQKAHNQTFPGDTVYLMDGTWHYEGNGTMFEITRSGAFNHETQEPVYITYKAFPGHTPVLYCTRGWNVIQVKASYIILDGITVKGDNPNITLEEGEAVYDYYIEQTSKGLTVDYNLFTRTNTNGINIDGRGLVKGGRDPIHHVTVRNCHVYDVPGGGIGANECDYITIENNLVHSNAWYMVWAGSGISVFHCMNYDNNTTTYKNIVRNNIVYDNETKVKWIDVKRYSDGNGIIIDDTKNTQINMPAYKGKTLVVNNICYENGGSGIHAFSSDNVDIINNTVYNNSRSPHINYAQLFASASNNCNLFNNIVYGRAGKPINTNSGSENVIFANNIYYNGNVNVMGPNDKVLDPKFVSLTPGAYDFRLQESSPAIDQGTRTLAPMVDFGGAVRPQGANRFDIGAYETSYTSQNPIENDVIDIAALNAGAEFVAPTAQAMKGTPTIDGEIDAIWATTQEFYTTKFDKGIVGATGTIRALWDENNLYVLVKVADPVLNKENLAVHERDSVEIFLDENNEKTERYQADDGQYRIDFEGEKSWSSKGKDMEFEAATKIVEGGYIVEVKLPLTTVAGSAGTILGFDVQINDAWATNKREAIAIWSNTSFHGWTNTSKNGNLKLVTELEFNLSPASVSPTTATFNKSNPTNIDFTVETNGNILAGLKNGNYNLVEGTDYTVIGSVYRVSKNYLMTLANSSVVIMFDFDGALDIPVTIHVTGTPQSNNDNNGNNGNNAIIDIQPIGEKVFIDGIEASISVITSDVDSKGSINVKVEVPVEQILKQGEKVATEDQPLKVTIPISSTKLLKQMNQDEVKASNITVQMSNKLLNSDIINAEIKMDYKLLEAAKAAGKDITVTVVDEKGKELYSWIFAGDNLAASDQKITDVNLSLKVNVIDKNEKLTELLKDGMKNKKDDPRGLLVNFDHEGNLPAQTGVRVYVGDLDGFKKGDSVYPYYYNSVTGKLETLPYSSKYKVDKDGYVTIELLQCSDYVLLPKRVDNSIITSLRKQISVSPMKNTLYLEETKKSSTTIQIYLPQSLRVVNNLNDKTIGNAVGAVTVSYESSNEEVVIVNSDGEITAKGAGTAWITTTVTLYSGKIKTVRSKITVK